jgi:hypothetical protein
MKKFIALCYLAFLCSTFLFSQTWTISNVTANIANYDNKQVTSTVSVTVTRSPTTGTASFYLLVGGATYGDYTEGRRRVYINPVNLYDSSSKILIRRTSSASTEIGSLNQSSVVVLSSSFTAGQGSKSITFYVSSSTGEIPDGTYTNSFFFNLYVGSTTAPNGTFTLASGGIITVTLTSVGAETFSITIPNPIADLGEVNPDGDEVSTTIRVTAPARYTISAWSKNSSVLINPASSDTIPYKFYFNGSSTATSLANGLTQLVYNSNAATDLQYQLRFATDPIGFLEAGNYTDTVTFMFTSQ